MKFLLPILFLSCLWSQPIHHKFKDYMINEGYVDNFSLYHAGIGGIKGVACNIGERVANRYGYDYPNSFQLLGINLALALAWEVAEFGIESRWNWTYYDEMYGGYALRNNGMDVALDMLVFSIPLWDDVYYDFKRRKNGFELQIEVLLK